MVRLKHRQLKVLAATIALYVLVAIWATWPLAMRPTTHFQQGSMTSPTVPLLNIWTAWWNSDRALHAGQGYWDAPIFFPDRNTFALSEPQPTLLIVSPVIWLTGSRVLAYNIYLWLSLILNGLFAARLLRQLGTARLIATAGGLAMMLLPYVHWQRDVIQLVPVWGILWTLSGVLKLTATPSWKTGAETGVAFSLACLSCLHYGLFVVIPLALASLVLIRRSHCLRVLAAGGVAAAIIFVLVGPFAWTIRQETSADRFVRAENTVVRQSAEMIDYVSSRDGQWMAFHPELARKDRGLSVGWCTSLLALLGLAGTIRKRRTRRTALFVLLIGLTAFLMSLGPNLQVAGWQPWWTLTSVLPMFARVRNVFRFAVLVQIVITLLAFRALHEAMAFARAKKTTATIRRFALAAIFLLAMVMIGETPPPDVGLSRAPDVARQADWIDVVREQATDGHGVICLPMSTGTKVSQFAVTGKWMYLGTWHGKPLLNGYSGYFPSRYFQIRREIHKGFPTAESLRLLAESDVEIVVVDRNEFMMGDLAESEVARLELLFSDPIGIDIYRIAGKSTGED